MIPLLRRTILASICIASCRRSDASTTASTATSAQAPREVQSVALTPLTPSGPASTSVTTPSTLAPLVTTAAVARTTARVPSPKRDPIKACCDALRKQSPPQFAQASAICDGLVTTLDDTGQAPEVERLIKPMLLDAPLPPACKGL